jgi:curved DNA-binding protein CbpA
MSDLTCNRGAWYHPQRKQGRDQEGIPQSTRSTLPLSRSRLTSSQAALAHHPDKVAEDERAEAEIRFKAAKQAYEILNDDDKRHLYDTHGMSAFDPSNGMGGGGPDMDDIFAQMFGGMGGFGGMPGMGGMGGMPGGGRNVPRKGRSVEQEYEVSLEELYKGKTTKFSNTKNVVCSVCKGSGGKQGAKSHSCGVCNGRGMSQSSSCAASLQGTNSLQVPKPYSVKSALVSSPKKPYLAATVKDLAKSSPRSSAVRSARATKSSSPRMSSNSTSHAVHERASG